MPQDSKRIVVFDVETTGTSPESDQIIELCIQRSLLDETNSQTWRFKPDVPIQPGAQAVHGISMDDLKDCPRFADEIPAILEIFESAEILVGYNVQFDLGFLLNEFMRAKVSPPNLGEKIIIDPFQLWRHFEPRTLAGAHKKFVGSEFDGAHGASADVAATGRVLKGMLGAFGLDAAEWPEVSQFCPIHDEQKAWIGPSNHFQWDKAVAVFGFGKHRGRPIISVAQAENGSYVDWMTKKTFPNHVLEIASRARVSTEEEFYIWLRQLYPQPKA